MNHFPSTIQRISLRMWIKAGLCFFVTLLNQLYWCISATLGCLLGSILNFNTKGVSFVMTAMFVVIFLEQWLKEEHHITSMIGIIASVIYLIIFGLNSFMIPTMAVIVITLTVSKRRMESLDVQK